MCGRYVNVASTADLTEEFDVEEAVGDDVPPSWNIAPTDPVRIVVRRRPHGAEDSADTVRQLRTVRWGLVPSWSKSRKPNLSMINARVETVWVKPAFKAAAGRRRALIPAAGYYEWQKTDGGKTPYFLHAEESRLLAFAGLYELWRDPDLPEDHPDKWLWTSTIITRPATDALGHIHERCPVLVPEDQFESWLDCSSGDPAIAQRLLDGFEEPHLQPRQVSAAVGKVSNNGPELIEPAEAEPAVPQQLSF